MGELATLGLDQAAEEVYRILVSQPVGTRARLRTLVPARLRDRLDEVVTALVTAGLVTVDGTRLHPVPPDVALDALVAGRAAALAATQRVITDLAAQYRNRPSRPDPERVVEEVTGVDAVDRRIIQLYQLARTEVRRLEPTAGSTPALAPGVTHRMVVTLTPNGDDPAVRVSASLPARLVLCDERFAILRTGDEHALLVRQSALIRALAALFEVVWEGAVPRSGAEPAAEDRQILALLATGATDETIGRRLGASTRTVRRRIHELMAKVGVSTRLQLGLEASRRGWV